MTRKDVKRFSLFSTWMSKLEARPQYSTTSSEGRQITLGQNSGVVEPSESHFFSIQASDWADDFEARDEVSTYLTLLLAYACVHLGALGLVFPTGAERLLWEISCIILIVVAGGLGVLFLIIPYTGEAKMSLTLRWNVHSRRSQDIENDGYTLRTHASPLKSPSRVAKWVVHAILCGDGGQWWVHSLNNTWKLLIVVPVGFVGVAYCIARVYLIVESFLSLRHVPIGVYQTPSGDFKSYIPHL
jgi:hypothetical protein